MSTTITTSTLESLVRTLGNQYELRNDGNTGWRLETPLSLPDNDRLGVYVRALPDSRLEITDLGETMGNLYLSGVTLEPDDERLVTIARRFGVRLDGGVISTATEPEHVAEAINAVVHAILDTAYLVYTRRRPATSSFCNEIDAWLTLEHHQFRRNFGVVGRSSTNTFDYYLPRRGRPMLIEAISAIDAGTSRRSAMLAAFRAFDSQGGAGGAAFDYACLLDDRTLPHRDALTSKVIQTVSAYFPTVLYWSDRSGRDAAVAA